MNDTIVYCIFQGLLLGQPSIFFSTPVHGHKWIKFLDNIISLLPDVEETYLLQEV